MERVGIVGTGWGLMHLGAFRAAGASVVALCGRDADKTREIAKRENIPLATGEVAELVESCDIVVVASPPDVHVSHARLALDRGRHVLCEKPLSRSARDAAELVECARANPHLVAAVNFPSRFLGPLGALRDRAARGALGRLRAASYVVTHGFGPERIGMSALPSGDSQSDDAPASREHLAALGPSAEFGGASHPVDAILWLTGERPAWVAANFTGSAGQGISILIGAESGASLAVTFAAGHVPGIRGTFRAIGDASEAEFAASYVPALGGWEAGPVTLDSGEVVSPRITSDPSVPGSDPWYLAHVAAARAFLGAVNNGGAGGQIAGLKLASFADGALVQRVLESAAHSALAGGKHQVI